ncbi:PucR family transcriptional regulator [Spongisporangium articulatum]|uniref:PucR family transcriptional regulator n=1 Tax=Spongisporangium articulatum TaxID=3362603 RepID=A0ABW8AJ01_9ACTN
MDKAARRSLTPDGDEVAVAARRLVATAARSMQEQLPALSPALNEEIAGGFPELDGDHAAYQLIGDSTVSNLEAFFLLARHQGEVGEPAPPRAAVELARRLAQRGVSSHALVRSYRVGQQRVLDRAFEEIRRLGGDGPAAYAAMRMMQSLSFDYVDRIAEEVVAEYEVERERWLSSRDTVRAAMVETVVAGGEVDVAEAERALGYRLRRRHLAAVVWSGTSDESTARLQSLTSVIAATAEALGTSGNALFVARDASTAWVWLPLGPGHEHVTAEVVDLVAGAVEPGVRVALGAPGSGLDGFRRSHVEAGRAFDVATIDGGAAEPVTSYADAGVRAAVLLSRDLESARDLVSTALGGLSEASARAELLRHTLRVFLSANGSYVAAAERLHVHKNTVKYRVDKAVALRGRPLEDDRLDLELALRGSRWLGRAVLPAP